VRCYVINDGPAIGVDHQSCGSAKVLGQLGDGQHHQASV
jgi:hypothetical protein